VTFQPPGRGVLPAQALHSAIAEKVIWSETYLIPDGLVQPASADLRIGDTAYRLRCSFLPDQMAVEQKLQGLGMDELDLSRGGAVLERNRPYLIPLVEELRLPSGVAGRTNPKSSTGRLDIFTRVITDHSHRFDEIRGGYHGPLYLEVVSRSFTIRVEPRLSLNQLRLFVPPTRCDDDEIRELHRSSPLLYRDNAPVRDLEVGGGLFLGLDLRGDENGVVGYRAKKNSQLLDLGRLDHYEAEDFWEPVRRERGNRIVLEPEEFYLLLSEESIRIPPTHAAEMTAYDPTSGELRTHYAGFFDPGFGFSRDASTGSRAALEVRAHDVPFMVEHGQKVCRLSFERMAEAPVLLYGEDLQSHYQYQIGTLSKHFKRPVPPPRQMRLITADELR
jgi:dCTP deaminase